MIKIKLYLVIRSFLMLMFLLWLLRTHVVLVHLLLHVLAHLQVFSIRMHTSSFPSPYLHRKLLMFLMTAMTLVLSATPPWPMSSLVVETRISSSSCGLSFVKLTITRKLLIPASVIISQLVPAPKSSLTTLIGSLGDSVNLSHTQHGWPP